MIRSGWNGWEETLRNSWTEGLCCVLDTDIVIDYLRKREYARKLLAVWASRGLLAISTLTHLEVYQGIKGGEEDTTTHFLDGLTSLVVDVNIARRAGKIIAEQRTKGITTGMGDAIIAATAIEYEVPVLTNNITHYSLKELKIIRGSG
jgi:predicted nucleic acid-binding protein